MKSFVDQLTEVLSSSNFVAYDSELINMLMSSVEEAEKSGETFISDPLHDAM